MPLSFTLSPKGALAPLSAGVRRKVLVTGASGHIGHYFAGHAHDRYDLRLMIRTGETGPRVDDLRKWGEVVEAELTSLDDMKRVCTGIDAIVHLAGQASADAVWSSLLPANIIGTYNTLLAAKIAGCRRVVYASSIHAVSGYAKGVQVHTTDPVNPGDLYGVSKCFGEALCRYMAEKENLSCIALRIGAFQPIEAAVADCGLDMLDAWVSERDMQQLIERCIDVEHLQFAVFHGLSDNRFQRLDISDAKELLGYAPVDDATQLNEKIKGLNLVGRVAVHSVSDARQKSGLRDDLPSSK